MIKNKYTKNKKQYTKNKKQYTKRKLIGGSEQCHGKRCNGMQCTRMVKHPATYCFNHSNQVRPLAMPVQPPCNEYDELGNRLHECYMGEILPAELLKKNIKKWFSKAAITIDITDNVLELLENLKDCHIIGIFGIGTSGLVLKVSLKGEIYALKIQFSSNEKKRMAIKNEIDILKIANELSAVQFKPIPGVPHDGILENNFGDELELNIFGFLMTPLQEGSIELMVYLKLTDALTKDIKKHQLEKFKVKPSKFDNGDLEIISQNLCTIFEKLHREKGIVHGDGYFANIILNTETLDVKLIDFDRAAHIGRQVGALISEYYEVDMNSIFGRDERNNSEIVFNPAIDSNIFYLVDIFKVLAECTQTGNCESLLMDFEAMNVISYHFIAMLKNYPLTISFLEDFIVCNKTIQIQGDGNLIYITNDDDGLAGYEIPMVFEDTKLFNIIDDHHVFFNSDYFTITKENCEEDYVNIVTGLFTLLYEFYCRIFVVLCLADPETKTNNNIGGQQIKIKPENIEPADYDSRKELFQSFL